MNKALALIALLGLVSAPAFATEAPAKGEKVVVKDGAATTTTEEGAEEGAAKEGK